MKNIIVIFLSVSSVCAFGMELDPFGGFGMEKDPRLIVINNLTQKIVVRYEPLLPGIEDANSLIPASLGSSIIPLPRITTAHTQVTVDPGKKAQLKQLLTPFVTITIGGFTPVENLPIVQPHIPLVINAADDNKIKIMQGTDERAIIETLQLRIQQHVRSAGKKEKEKISSDDDWCCLQ